MIYLLRHTRPDVEMDRCYGASDVGLHSDFSEIHLPEVLSRVEGFEPTIIYSSPLRRCRLLADEVRKHLSLESVVEDDRLREMNFGDWELQRWDDIFAQPEGRAWFDDFLNVRTPRGESFADLERRAESFFASIEGVSGDVIVVTHAGFVRATLSMLGIVERGTLFDYKVEYGELILIDK